MAPILRRSLFALTLIVFAGALYCGLRHRAFEVTTVLVVDGVAYPAPHDDVPEWRLNIASTFSGATVDEDGRLLGNPYEWVNEHRLCPT
ncbi:MAG: hypothetical protein ACE5R4_02700 [Armatimonadota bacterium]